MLTSMHDWGCVEPHRPQLETPSQVRPSLSLHYRNKSFLQKRQIQAQMVLMIYKFKSIRKKITNISVDERTASSARS